MGTTEGAQKARAAKTRKRAEASPVPDDCALLLAGVDSLHLSSAAELRADLVKDLLEQKALASKCAQEGLPLPRWRTTMKVNGVDVTLDLEVQPRGTKKGDLLLRSPALDLVLHSRPPKNLPAAYVELHAVFLWSGWDYASDVGAGLLREVAASPEHADVQTSRIDLAADFCGWQPDEDLRRHLRGRFRRWTKDYVPKQDRVHGYGRSFTGFTFGGGALLCRLYDKTVEIRSSGKQWFVPKWQAAGYVDEKTSGHVWRLEFQVRREVLRKCELVTREMQQTPDGVGSTEVKRWADLKKGLNDLWRYMTSRWLTYRLPRTGKKRVRLHPRWVTLMRAQMTPLPDGELYRHQRLWNMNTYRGAIAGYTKREAALEWMHRDREPDEQRFEADLVELVRAAMKHYEERRGESLFDAARAQWTQFTALDRLFGGAERLARKPEQMKLAAARRSRGR